ncbi:hypothetical protein [Streptomyces uncialis]|uniref:hypothetical protein n=1 Tax=Streptomyces uncialis TaxID=1048205 RepID=UPI00386D3549|nr:hypothetical protein OG268_35845 [Streptomyces uncialis]
MVRSRERVGVVVRRPVEGNVEVHYSQIYVESDPDGDFPELAEALGGQRNGLCGAATPGLLWLITGLHTGSVVFTVEVHDQAPPLDDGWEEIVEVSFRPASTSTALVEWGGGGSWDLGLDEIDHRVRYCAAGMDEGKQHDTRFPEEAELDRYLLQFWPAPPGPDRVLKQTSEVAAYWHDYAQEQPPPPTPAERAEVARRARLAEEEAERRQRLAYELWQWGGKLPSPALSAVGGSARGLLRFDPALVHALDAAGSATQRQVAVLAARRACEAAGLTALDPVAAALTDLAEGRPLPPPFNDPDRAWRALESDPRFPDRTVAEAVPPERPPFEPPARDGVDAPVPQPSPVVHLVGPAAMVAPPDYPSPTGATVYALITTVGRPVRPPRMSQPHMAVPALFGAAGSDPLRAALDSVFAAVVTYGEDYPVLLREIRSACQEYPRM